MPTDKNCHQDLRNMCWGSGIGDSEKPISDPGVKKALDQGLGIRDPGSGKNLSGIQGSKKHWITDPDQQHW